VPALFGDTEPRKCHQSYTLTRWTSHQAFINHSHALIDAGKLTAAQGQPLIDAANAVRIVMGFSHAHKRPGG